MMVDANRSMCFDQAENRYNCGGLHSIVVLTLTSKSLQDLQKKPDMKGQHSISRLP